MFQNYRDILIVYGILINTFTFVLYYIDKKRASKGKFKNRISEKMLLTMSLIGGSFGAVIAVTILRHKTKKLKFKVINSVMVIVNLFIIYRIFI